MAEPAVLAELWRGEFLEGVHRGHAVVVDARGEIIEAWGDPELPMYPRSAIKILQALPLVESGAADRAQVSDEELALACASHSGSAAHTVRVKGWLERIGMVEEDLRCGPSSPRDAAARAALRAAAGAPGQLHNPCSGKHSGFLTLARDIGAGPEYIDPAHPVQTGVRETMEALTGMPVPGYGIDGCSAPNYRTTLRGFATAMAQFAAPDGQGPARAAAMRRLYGAMRDHPVMVDGVGTATTELTLAANGKAVVKFGAEGVFSGILPERGWGLALKIDDGASRAVETAMAALMVRLGLVDPGHPAVSRLLNTVQPNARGIGAARVIPGQVLL